MPGSCFCLATQSSFFKIRIKLFALLIIFSVMQGCQGNAIKKDEMNEIQLIVLDPGHFHAALVQKSMYDEVDSVVHVYAPDGPEVDAYLGLINKYNTRTENPTSWNEIVYKGKDYLDKMLLQKPGNLVMLAGNNRQKTGYIKKSVDAGLNVLADKPMAITSADFELLKASFDNAKKNGVVLYDIMTSRYDITNILQKELSQLKELFGELEKGSLENPAILKQSTHHFFKTVSGAPLVRPAWFFDTDQEGNGLVDVTTHFVDLIQWECFPENILDYKKDINVVSAKRWATKITPEQFTLVTKKDSFPGYLKKDVKDNVLNVYSNGEMNYTLKGIHAKVSVNWNFEAPEGTSDTHYSSMRGTKANLFIRQGKEQQFKPALYIEPVDLKSMDSYEKTLAGEFKQIEKKYPGISLLKNKKGWEVIIPDQLKIDHEKQFELVTKKYLEYLKQGKMPDWEISFMLAKYYTTTKALDKALD